MCLAFFLVENLCRGRDIVKWEREEERKMEEGRVVGDGWGLGWGWGGGSGTRGRWGRERKRERSSLLATFGMRKVFSSSSLVSELPPQFVLPPSLPLSLRRLFSPLFHPSFFFPPTSSAASSSTHQGSGVGEERCQISLLFSFSSSYFSGREAVVRKEVVPDWKKSGSGGRGGDQIYV